MAEIQFDADVLNEGRKEPLKDVDAPLRDQIVAKLFNKLEEDGIGEEVQGLWKKGHADRTEWLKRQQTFLASWDSHEIADTEGAFSGSSQLHIPMPFIVIKTLHARFIQAIWQDPPCHTKANNEASIERVSSVQDTMRWYLMNGANYNSGVESVVDKWVWDWLTAGSGIMKWRWDVKYTRFIDVEEVEEVSPPVEMVVDGKRQLLPGKPRLVEKEIKRTKKVFDGPVLDLVNPENLIIVGGGGDPDLADAVLHSEYLTASQLWTLADRKIFNKDAVEAVLAAGEDGERSSDEMQAQRDSNAGRAGEVEGLSRYEIVEAYMQKDVDGSGITADIVAWVHLASGSLLRATYLHRVSKSGERPFAKADFHMRKGQEYGTGMVEILYPLAKELDAQHNMRLDFGLVSVMPFGFYRASSGLDPDTIQMEPGMLIPVDNPQTDVFFPNLGNRTAFGMQEEAAIMQMIERITSVSDMSFGVLGAQGVARTASGARGLMSEMNSNLDVYLRRLNRGWRKTLRYLFHMLQQRIPAGLSFRITGDDGKDYWRVIKQAKDLDGDFDFEVSPNTSTSNVGIQQEIASQVMQAVADPLAIQMGCITPLGYYEAKKNLMQSLGVRDYGRYFQRPAQMQRLFTPEEEANRILRGIFVPVVPESDHQGFLDYWNMIFDNDELLGQFNEAQTIELAKHAKKHEQMLQAVAAMQAQAANVAQMRMNASQSQQQAPTGLNPMAGSGAAPSAPGANVA